MIMPNFLLLELGKPPKVSKLTYLTLGDIQIEPVAPSRNIGYLGVFFGSNMYMNKQINIVLYQLEVSAQ